MSCVCCDGPRHGPTWKHGPKLETPTQCWLFCWPTVYDVGPIDEHGVESIHFLNSSRTYRAYGALHSQKAVSAQITSKQILPFGFAEQTRSGSPHTTHWERKKHGVQTIRQFLCSHAAALVVCRRPPKSPTSNRPLIPLRRGLISEKKTPAIPASDWTEYQPNFSRAADFQINALAATVFW